MNNKNSSLNQYRIIDSFVRNSGRNIVDKFAYRNGEYYFIQTEWVVIKNTKRLWMNKQMSYENFLKMIK